jgi:putative heme-binding domain-containing protein
MQARLDLRAGADKGRIYRVRPEGKPLRAIPNLATMTSREQVVAMNHPNGWQRDMAQRLLIERADPAAQEALVQLLSVTHPPQVRLQALATLGGLKALTPEILQIVLADPHPAVRCEALRQSEALPNTEAVFNAVAGLANDSDAAVRLQTTFSLGAWPAEKCEPVLRQLAARDDADELQRTAVMSSLRPESALFAQLNTNKKIPKPVETVSLTPSSSDRAQVIASYAGVAKLTGDAGRGREHFQKLCAPCHRLRGEGNEVGADLGMVGNKPVDWLLTAILDPNQAVEARYRAWTLTLNSGETLDGILSAETANNVVLRAAGSTEHPVLRGDIAALKPSQLSLMPVGFESALKPQDMADLLQWLRSP